MYLINIFRSTSDTALNPARNENSTMSENFERLRQWFENEPVPMTTSEMYSKMIELADSREVYSMKQIKRKLDATYK